MADPADGGVGDGVERLHPMLRRRFGASTASGCSCVGRGVMEEVWHGPAWTLPFLHLGAWPNILVPDAGTDVPPWRTTPAPTPTAARP